jgi:hypothetical protein
MYACMQLTVTTTHFRNSVSFVLLIKYKVKYRFDFGMLRDTNMDNIWSLGTNG